METLKTIVIKIAIALFIALVAGLVLWYGALPLIEKAVRQGEVAECMKLERQSREFGDRLIEDEQGNLVPLFYLTEWQSEMCKAHGFAINARIES